MHVTTISWKDLKFRKKNKEDNEGRSQTRVWSWIINDATPKLPKNKQFKKDKSTTTTSSFKASTSWREPRNSNRTRPIKFLKYKWWGQFMSHFTTSYKGIIKQPLLNLLAELSCNHFAATMPWFCSKNSKDRYEYRSYRSNGKLKGPSVSNVTRLLRHQLWV